MRKFSFIFAASLLLAACSDDDTPAPDPEPTPDAPTTHELRGFYLLNDGNLGMNAASLDFYDYQTAQFSQGVYVKANPNVVMALGDAGNDLKIYGSRMYAVINGSNKVEVMTADSCKRVGQVEIANPRYMAFDGDYAYITSFAGNIELTPDYTQRGYLAKVDTKTLKIVARCEVGFQPEGVAIVGGKAYVANSGGYMAPNYENTLSVVDLATMTVTDTIQIAINLQYVVADSHGCLWVTSRGDYGATPATLSRYDLSEGKVTLTLPLSVGALWLEKDELYTVGQVYDENWNSVNSYAAVNVLTGQTRDFVSQAVKQQITTAYGIAVNPDDGQIIVTDAGNFVNPGFVHCLDPQGNLLWSKRAGDIPGQIAFLR